MITIHGNTSEIKIALKRMGKDKAGGVDIVLYTKCLQNYRTRHLENAIIILIYKKGVVKDIKKSIQYIKCVWCLSVGQEWQDYALSEFYFNLLVNSKISLH